MLSRELDLEHRLRWLSVKSSLTYAQFSHKCVAGDLTRAGGYYGLTLLSTPAFYIRHVLKKLTNKRINNQSNKCKDMMQEGCMDVADHPHTPFPSDICLSLLFLHSSDLSLHLISSSSLYLPFLPQSRSLRPSNRLSGVCRIHTVCMCVCPAMQFTGYNCMWPAFLSFLSLWQTDFIMSANNVNNSRFPDWRQHNHSNQNAKQVNGLSHAFKNNSCTSGHLSLPPVLTPAQLQTQLSGPECNLEKLVFRRRFRNKRNSWCLRKKGFKCSRVGSDTGCTKCRQPWDE